MRLFQSWRRFSFWQRRPIELEIILLRMSVSEITLIPFPDSYVCRLLNFHALKYCMYWSASDLSAGGFARWLFDKQNLKFKAICMNCCFLSKKLFFERNSERCANVFIIFVTYLWRSCILFIYKKNVHKYIYPFGS